MTIQEAIKRIENHIKVHSLREPMAIYITEALKMAINALKEQKVTLENKERLKYYLETNEENGVVYIPKFIVEKIVGDK